MKHHAYTTKITWTGNNGEGTKNYIGYRRDHTIESSGKPPIEASSDPAFRGDPTRYNPEELLLASLSSCHLLWYLHLCASNGIVAETYEDVPSGVMDEAEDGSGKFIRVDLNPVVIISSGAPALAIDLHHEAHRKCFIANSVNFPVSVKPSVHQMESSAR